MKKVPAFQFYIKDWLSDPQLKMASFSAKGMWIYLLCFMWECPERGKISGTKAQIMKVLGATEIELNQFLTEAKTLNFCDVTKCNDGCNDNVTIINRRMHREWKEKENTRLRVQKFRGSVDGNDNVTEMYSRARAADGDSSNINSSTFNDSFFAFWEAYPKKIGKKEAFRAWQKAVDKPDIDTILMAIRNQVNSDAWRRNDGQYIPHPATWLNQGRWDDEPRGRPRDGMGRLGIQDRPKEVEPIERLTEDEIRRNQERIKDLARSVFKVPDKTPDGPI